MPLKLENVRLTPFDAIADIPAGFKVVGEFKTRRDPSPMNYNWYSRWDSVQHEVFFLLAMAVTATPSGYTVEELKALYTNDADKAKVDEIINKFKGSWDHRHTGFDLVANEAGDRFMLTWRDPRVNYVKEIGLDGDFVNVAFQKVPSYVEKVPQLIEEARNPKPVVEKPAKVAKDPAAPKAKVAKSAEPASAAPTGGYKAAFALVPVTVAGVEGTTIAQVLDTAIAKLVDSNALLVDDVTAKVIDRLNAVIDANGLEASHFVDFVARYQKETSIKAGFYKICKDLAKAYAAHVKGAIAAAAAPAVAASPVAAVATEAAAQ